MQNFQITLIAVSILQELVRRFGKVLKKYIDFKDVQLCHP